MLWIWQWDHLQPFLKTSRNNFDLETKSHIKQEMCSKTKVRPAQCQSHYYGPMALPANDTRTETSSPILHWAALGLSWQWCYAYSITHVPNFLNAIYNVTFIYLMFNTPLGSGNNLIFPSIHPLLPNPFFVCNNEVFD